MDNIIKIVKISNFSITPGSRYKSEGNFSAEEFREDILIPAFNEAVEAGKKLVIDLDGTIGYGTSFLEAVFGGLARQFGVEIVLATLEFVSNEEEYLVEDIKNYINETYESDTGNAE